jgi:hypothetical protein
MGYRSEVSVVMTRELFSQIAAKIPNELAELVRYCDNFVSKENAVLMYWNYIKWYEDNNSSVAQFMKAISGADTDHYQFIELGEDLDHCSQKGAYWDNPFGVDIVRKLAVDLNGSKGLSVAVFL